MKTLIVVCSLALAAIGVYAVQSSPSAIFGIKKPVTQKVGVNPGDIFNKVKDPDAVAKARGHELATFAAGCFWGVEQTFRTTPGVVATAVGYSGGHVVNPTYEEVCTHTTGHAESVMVEFDPKKVSYDQLLTVFWTHHNPTQVDRQGPDYGSNYRGVVFFRNAEQEKLAKAKKDALNKSGKYKRPIVTQIVSAAPFYVAEDYHQQWDEKHGIESCPIDDGTGG